MGELFSDAMVAGFLDETRKEAARTSIAKIKLPSVDTTKLTKIKPDKPAIDGAAALRDRIREVLKKKDYKVLNVLSG